MKEEKTMKKLLCMILVLITVMSLCACGKGPSDPGQDDSSVSGAGTNQTGAENNVAASDANGAADTDANVEAVKAALTGTWLPINKNKYEQSLLTYHKTNLTAIQEVNDSLSNLKLDNEKYVKNLETLGMEEKDFKFSEYKYNEGTISKLDLLQRKEALLVMQQLVASSQTDCLVNQISLYKAVAGNL